MACNEFVKESYFSQRVRSGRAVLSVGRAGCATWQPSVGESGEGCFLHSESSYQRTAIVITLRALSSQIGTILSVTFSYLRELV